MNALEALTYEVLRATADQERKRCRRMEHYSGASDNRNLCGVKSREMAQYLRKA